MLKAVFLVAVLSSFAQILPSCGGSPGDAAVVGWVEAKFVDRTSAAYTITILGTEYDVPGYFYQEVKVGDLVKWDGKVWTIVKKAAVPRLAAARNRPRAPANVAGVVH